ncbi:MAG: NUDIX domain-containing protein [Candidatus Woesearchaeota archaeon]|jgi:8-oxo-dGTP pyrophosphatase MutT (NUDIX family)
MIKRNYTSEDLNSHHAIAVIIKNKRGEVLMQEHAKYGFWTIPLGKVHQKQTIEEGLKQEMFDECNILIKEFKELKNKKYYYSRLGKRILVSGHLFEISKFEGKIKNNEFQKHKQQIFLSIDKIKQLSYLSDLTLLYLETIGIKRKAKI